MLDTAIILTFLILLTLLSVKFGVVSIIGSFAAVTFFVGFFLVIFLYFYHHPKITFTLQPVERESHFNYLYNINLIINDKSSTSHDYKELALKPEAGLLITTDANAEVFHAYTRDKNLKSFFNKDYRFQLHEHKARENTGLVHSFPLVAPKNKEIASFEITLSMHSNPYDSGILAIFNPIYNYTIRDRVEVDLTKLLNEPQDE